MNDASKRYIMAVFSIIAMIITLALYLIKAPVIIIILYCISIFIFLILNPKFTVGMYIFCSLHSSIMSYELFGFRIGNLLLFVAFAAWLFDVLCNRIERTNKIHYSSIYLVIAYFIAMCVISVFNDTKDYKSLIYFVLNNILLIVMVLDYVSTKENVEYLLKILLWSGFLIAAFGIYEVIIGKTYFYSEWTIIQRYRYGIIRMGSTVAGPNAVSFMLLPFLPIISYFYTNSSKRSHKLLYGTLFLLFNLCVLLTLSRAGIILLIFMYYLLSIRKIYISLNKKLLFIHSFIIAAFMVIVIIVLSVFANLTSTSETMSSFNARTKALQVSYDQFKRKPIVGIGFDRLEEKNALYMPTKLTRTGGIASMNLYLKVVSENGILVFVLFIIIMMRALLIYKRYSLRHVLFSYLFVSFIIMSLNLFTIDSYGYLFILIAIALGAYMSDCYNKIVCI